LAKDGGHLKEGWHISIYNKINPLKLIASL
jgi:hypothetical protein